MTGRVERIGDREGVFHWTVEKFSSLKDDYDSPDFHFCGLEWFLRLLPNGYDSYLSQCRIDLQLWLKSPEPLLVRYSVGVAKAGGGKEVWEEGTETVGDGFHCVNVDGIWRTELSRRREELLPGDRLTVTVTMRAEAERGVEDASVRATVECHVTDASVQTEVEESATGGGEGGPSAKTGPEKIVEDVGKLWESGDHTDVVLKVGDREFRAHRTILAARTPVLGAMFRHKTTEAASGEVTIEDCEPEVFQELLYFIYKGVPRHLTAQNAPALYVLADRYLVGEVKALCVRCMRDSLCLNTFCDTLTLSLMHREDELLKAATEFLSKNLVRVMQTVEWQRFLREHPTWANEIMIRAAQVTEARYEEEKRALADRSAL